MSHIDHAHGGGTKREHVEATKAAHKPVERDENGSPRCRQFKGSGPAPDVKLSEGRPLPSHQGGVGAYSKAGC